MPRAVNRRKLLIQGTATVLVLLGLVGWFVYSQTQPLDRNELKIEVASLRSFSSEAEVLAKQGSSNTITQTFFQVQTYLLRDKADSSRSSLDKTQVEAGLENDDAQARQLAAELVVTLDALNGSFADTPNLDRAGNYLQQLSSRLKELEEKLQ